MHVGSCSQTANHHIVADDLHIAAFHRANAVDVIIHHRIDNLGLEHRMEVVDGVQNHALAGAHLRGHVADHDVVEHGERSIAHEEQVGHRRECSLLVIDIGDVVKINAFNELAGKFLCRERFQVGCHEALAFCLADAVDKAVFHVFRAENVGQEVADFVDLRHFLQHFFEIAVFLLCDLHIQNVAEKVSVRVFRSYFFQFRAGGMNQNMLEFANFRVYTDIDGLGIHKDYFDETMGTGVLPVPNIAAKVRNLP